MSSALRFVLGKAWVGMTDTKESVAQEGLQEEELSVNTENALHKAVCQELEQSKPRLSVVVPIFNNKHCLAKTVESILGQTLKLEDYEIILVDDGSTDSSGEIADSLAEAYDNVRAVHQENAGVSAARNLGMDLAQGHFIAFVDSDDTLEPVTLEGALQTFEAHEDEIDLLTYPMKIVEGKCTKSHVREKVLTATGVYDLSDPKNAFALVTNINVLVKNEECTPRFDASLEVHEDLQFMLRVLLRKQKVGFSKHGAYVYRKQGNSATNIKMHPYYSLEATLGFWEELFASYQGKDVPVYLQGSFMNELNWKIQQGLLLPPSTHESYEAALERYGALLSYVDDKVIKNSPRATQLQKHYFMFLKKEPSLTCELSEEGISICRGSEVVVQDAAVEAWVYRTYFAAECWCIRATLRSPAFEFVEEAKVHGFLQRGNESEVFWVPLRPSTDNYSFSHENLATTWAFKIDVPYQAWDSLQLFVDLGSHTYPVRWSFGKYSQLNTEAGTLAFSQGNVTIGINSARDELEFSKDCSVAKKLARKLQDSQELLKKNPKGLLLRVGAAGTHFLSGKKPFWLYSDSITSDLDNAYYQFTHDIAKNDGIERYYVVHNEAQRKALAVSKKYESQILDFGDSRHRALFPSADKIITAFVELENWCPYKQKALNCISAVGKRDLIYLQHGVLQAHAPWKYGAERTAADRVVISTPYEKELLTSVYNYDPEQLIEAGMPRYDFISTEPTSSSRILFAPSWRKYLVTEQPGKAPLANSRFRTSRFWVETKAFLTDPRLLTYLEQNDLYFDIKLHPYFRSYKPYFEALENERVRVIDQAQPTDYKMLITDYSSIAFDFVYARRPLVYFFPDEEEFKAGLNGYSSLDLPMEDGFGPIARNSSELLEMLEGFNNSEGFGEVYTKRSERFFYWYDNGQRQRIYEALIG